MEKEVDDLDGSLFLSTIMPSLTCANRSKIIVLLSTLCESR